MAQSRSTDPVSSTLAADAIERSGIAAAHRRLCLAQVQTHPGQTAAEIARAVGLERHAPSRRLPELREAGLVANGPMRVCAVKGRQSLTWLPAGEALP